MRSEKQMYKLIKDFARKDDRIRGIVLNGSRANPNVERDPFQDYDIVYLVTDIEPFKDENYIINHFGEVMLMQKPEEITLIPPEGDGRYIYLIQFYDGNRIDMQFRHIDKAEKVVEDSLTEILLDKDDFIPETGEPDESSYFIQQPTEKYYWDCCSEFYFGIGSQIPKTIWRKELPLLKNLIYIVLRKPLVQMLKWHIGNKYNFKVSAGKGWKNLKKYLEHDYWQKYKKTYSDYKYDNIWNSLFVFHELFTEIAANLAEEFDYKFPQKDAENSIKYLRYVKKLPEDRKIGEYNYQINK
ncbi:MAG: aminoglycoside 6-adenylyltransferase [Candidatus Mcinerneyibacterium aminivorans]|uniref:Aminoglycoside 6-adenylyltransferase n=1 Tax=Candidatus Mcinerneyibacterium aminivorans TaxID=2703815 RepID=A0A5D0MK38_9BACT|nr:MAG: aminoglycoside 6-adenylyltransferase [Candidatus Mcinerneyibacterium aminivorans]